MIKKFFVIGVILFFAGSCFAATAGNTSDPKIPYGSGIANMEKTGMGPFKFSFDGDWIFEKNLGGKSGTSDAEIEGEWYLFRIGYTFADRIEPYVKFGMSHLKAAWKQEGYIRLKVKGENAFAVGVGTKLRLYEIPEYRLRVSLDGQYLYTDPDIDRATIGAARGRAVTASEFEVKEWQIAGIVSLELPVNYDRTDPAAVYSIIPYIGLAYFDSETKAKFTYGETTYDLGKAENEENFLLITGCNVASPNNVSFNLEGRWVGEAAASAGFTAKF